MVENITSQGPRRPILRTLLVVLISLALALLLAEGMVRLADALGLVDLSPSLAEVAMPGQLEDQVDLGAASGTGGPLYVGDPVLHHRMAANWSGFFPEEIVQEVGRAEVPIRTNSLGLRSPEIALAKPSDTFRILVLGDSVTFGWSLRGEDTYTSQLASLLATLRPNQRVEVINAGVSGYGTWQELRWLQETGLALDPDVIIVQTHLNDAADNLWGTLGWQQDSDSWLVHTSMLARLISRVSSARQVGSGDAPCATDWKVDSDQVCWQRTEELLSEIQREASGLGAALVLMPSPMRWQVDAEVRDPRAWVDATRYQDVLAGYGRQHGWIVVDPLPAIRAATSSNDKSLFLDVGHPDEAGQRILAQELYSALSQGGLLP
jgi:lysophospholipase L1-like esterase